MASTVDTSVKFALSSMPGASVINGQASSRIAAIKAFAVTGWGLKAVDGAATISGGKCRLPFGSGASAALVNSVIQVSGATPAGLNGEQKVTAVSSGWVEFATALPDGPVTGTVSFKMAPLGWEEVFSKPNVSVFRPTDPRSSRPYLRVDDSNAAYVVVQMYESMTDVDTGYNGSPVRYWPGRSSASASGVSWALVGDSRGLYYCVSPSASSSADYAWNTGIWYFGDCNSARSGDAYPAVLMGDKNTSGNDGFLFVSTASLSYVMRIAAGIGASALTDIRPDASFGSVSGADTTMGPFPSRAGQALVLSPISVADGGTFSIAGPRGRIPGAWYCPQSGVLTVLGAAPGQLPGSGDYAGKTMLTLGVGPGISSAPNGVGFIDITGPWRMP